MKQSKKMQIQKRILSIKPGKPIVVKTDDERIQFINIGRDMKNYGQIEYDVVSRETNGGFKVGIL